MRAWIAFKLLLSATLVGAPIALFYAAPEALVKPEFIGISAVLLFFAALPWVSFEAPNRSLGLSCLVFSIGVGFVAFQTAFGSISFPRPCTNRRALLCEVENLLFNVGGKTLAALPFALLAALMLVAGVVIIARSRRGT